MNHKNDNGFNFLSHNTQGHRGDVHTSFMNELHNGKRKFVALQETGTPSDGNLKPVKGKKNLFSGEISASNGKRDTRNSKKKPIHALHYEFMGSKGGNNRTSMTMYSADKPTDFGIIKSKVPNVRPMMYMQFDNLTVANVHLPSGNAPFASKVLHGFMEDLESSLEKKQKKIKPNSDIQPQVLIMGDMNMDPKRVKNTVKAFGYQTSSPQTATHQGGGTLDHTIFKGGNVMNIRTNFNSSDHGNVQGTFMGLNSKK